MVQLPCYSAKNLVWNFSMCISESSTFDSALKHESGLCSCPLNQCSSCSWEETSIYWAAGNTQMSTQHLWTERTKEMVNISDLGSSKRPVLLLPGLLSVNGTFCFSLISGNCILFLIFVCGVAPDISMIKPTRWYILISTGYPHFHIFFHYLKLPHLQKEFCSQRKKIY